MSDQKVYLCQKLKELAVDLGRAPMRHEFSLRFKMIDIDGIFGTYDAFLVAAGVIESPEVKYKRDEKTKNKFKYSKSQIDSFSMTKIDLADLFAQCGNPDTIRVIAQPDTHVQYMDKKAVEVFLKFCEWYDPDGHIIMGDFLDAEGLSHWQNDELTPREFIPEVIQGRELLKRIVDVTPNAKLRVYLKGNHEDWIKQAMAAKLPALFNGLDKLGLMPDLQALLDLDKYGYDFIEMNHIFGIGKANFTHGLYTGNGHPKKHLQMLKTNIYYGHLHDVMAHHEPTMHGMIEAASLGCLCKLDAKFLKGKPTNWVHGFGVFEFFPDGTYSFYQIKILNGKFSFMGQVFAA